MQENAMLIFHNSGLNAKCFSVKLKLLAKRFLIHLQFYILDLLKEEGSGASTLGWTNEAAWLSQRTSRKISELSRASNAIVCMECME